MSILILVKVLEKLCQKPYFQSCDRNTAMSLANEREIEEFMGFPVPY